MVSLWSFNFSIHKKDEFKRENSLIVDSILFFCASTIKNLFIANNRQKKTYFKKVSKNVFFGYFAKAIAGKNGAWIRHILLNLV